MPKFDRKSFNLPVDQRGKVSLQSLFWIVGIIVGLLTILQITLSLPDITDEINLTESSDKAADNNKALEESPNPSALDTSSTKVGKYQAYDNGIAVDKALGIIWMRCSLGQEWNGSSCEGSAKAYSLEEAQQAIEKLNKVSYVGLYDWRLPNIEELHSLIDCSDGYDGSYSIAVDKGNSSGTKQTVAVDCAGESKTPAINQEVFPNTQWAIWRGYRSSTLNEEGEPLAVYFNDGKIKAKEKAHYVRLVRDLNP